MAEGVEPDWGPWGPAALARARDEGRPVLLSLVTPWCGECVAMDREVFADPAVREQIAAEFVPVRADADRRPRLRDRYAMGGFPSTVVLTPAGEIIAGTTSVGAAGLRQILEKVGERWRTSGNDAGRVPRALRAGAPPAGDAEGVEAAMVETLEHAADAANGGWGTGAKFPLPQAVSFALTRDRNRAIGSLDAAVGALQDDDGGMYRYAANSDWSNPHRAKLLDTNGAVLRTLAEAYCVTGSERFRDTAEDIIDYLTGTLWTGDGFGGSQAPPGVERSPAVPGRDIVATGAAAEATPPVDPTVFADRNAIAAEALCHVVAYTDDKRAQRYAERTLRVVASLIDGGSVAHYSEAPPAESGVLADQAAVVRAFTTAASVLGPNSGEGYLEIARAVVDETLSSLRVGPACIDGPQVGEGLLGKSLYPIGGNAVLADALIDLGALTDEPGHRETARELVDGFAGAVDRLEPALAGYARAAARATGEPLRIDVATPAGSDLHRAALRVANNEKIVVPGASRLSDAPAAGTVRINGPHGTTTASTPEALMSAVANVV